MSRGRSVVAVALAATLAGLLALTMVFSFAGCGDDDPVTPIPEPDWHQTLDPDYTHRAIWGVNSSHFFVAGEKGSISRYADGAWTTWQFLYFENMRGIWAAAGAVSGFGATANGRASRKPTSRPTAITPPGTA